jgi:hypothetical protein
MTLAPNTPAGWHLDPTGQPTMRWWDGRQWTDQLAPMPPPAYPTYGGVPERRGTNGMAVASLVLGLLWIYGVGAILALIFGEVARSQIKQSGQQQGGAGMAMAGRILGSIGIVVPLAIIILNNAN